MSHELPNLKDTRVLLVEDDPDCRDFFALVLQEQGVQVTAAPTAEDAVDLLKSGNFDIVATDKNLPNMDGVSLIRHIRQHYGELPVILITGFASVKNAVEVLKLGAQDYLCKPLEDSDELIRAIWNAMQHGRLARENKILQERLVGAKRLESIGMLAAGVAHEINNPTGFIYGNLELLRTDTQKMIAAFQELENLLLANLPADPACAGSVRGTLETIKKTANFDHIREDCPAMIDDALDGATRIKQIVAGMRSFARPDLEGSRLIDINDEIAKSLALVWNELKYHCELVKDLQPLPLVNANSGQIDQVLVNLMLNAGQAVTAGQGRLTVRTRPDGDFVLVEIEDNGKGIPQEDLSHIFEPFFTTKPVGKGMGLGLFVSYGIIEHHGGKMEVHSEAGTGTRFSIQLPIARQEGDPS